MANANLEQPRQATGGSLQLFGLLTLILGILAMLSPLYTGKAVGVLVGVFVLIAGIIRLGWALQARTLGQGMFLFLLGWLTCLCGLAMVSNPIMAAGVLTILLAVYLFLDGATEIAVGLRLRPQSGWVSMVLGGVLSIFLGTLIMSQYPLSGAWAIGILLGLKLIMMGVLMFVLGGTVSRARMQPDPL